MSVVDLDLKLALDALDAREVPPAAVDWEERLRGALTASPRRVRRLRLRLLVAACVAVAVFALLASGAGAWVGLPDPFGTGIHLLGPTHHVAAPSPHPSPRPSYTPRVTKTSSVTRTITHILPAGAPVPAGFKAVSVTFVSADDAYVLGHAAGARAMLLRTLDRGRHWRSLAGPPVPVESPALEGERCAWGTRFANPLHGFVFGNGLWETTDGGARWERVAAPSGTILSLATIDGQVLVLVRDGAHRQTETLARRSLDGGPWHVVTVIPYVYLPLASDLISTQAGTAAVLDGGTVLVTGDGGLSFDRRALPATSFTPTAVAATSASALALVATRLVGGEVEKRVYTSHDGGLHWRRVGAPADGAPVAALAGSPGGLVLATAADVSRLYRSGDGGRTWSIALVSPESRGWGWHDLGFTTDQNAIVVLGPQDAGRLLLSSSGGAAWGAVRLGPGATTPPKSRPGAAATAAPWPLAAGGDRDVWRTHTVSTRVELVSVDFSSAADGWAIGGPHASLFVTIDGGATWTPRGSVFNRWLTRVVSSDAGHGWAVGNGPRGSVIRGTSDGGATWSKTRSTASLLGIAQVGAAHAWAVGYGQGPGHTDARIVATADGATWAEQRVRHVRMLDDVVFVDAEHGWAVGGNAIVATTDGGVTWARQTLLSSIRLNAVTFVDAQHGWAAGAYVRGPSSGRAVVLGTTDGGAHWRPLSTGGPSSSIGGLAFADARHGWALCTDPATGHSFVIATRDSGRDWQTELSSAQSLRAIAALPPHGACVVGAGGSVLTTTGRP